MSNSWFAKMVNRDLGKFPGHIGEVISSFKSYQNGGWGKGLSSRHFTKIIARDETVFTTTWAELRREYFRELSSKMSPYISDVKVPLPCKKNGAVLSDAEIRNQVQLGYRLMFCPITKIHQIVDTHLLPRSNRSCFLSWEQKEWHEEIKKNLERMASKPYWFWIDCSEKRGKASFSPDQFSASAPSLVEYLIADLVLNDEQGRHLDEDGCTLLNHCCEDDKFVVLGGNPIKEIARKKIGNFYREYEDSDGSKIPIYARGIDVA